MGIEWHAARFLIGAAKLGTSFRRTLTLGRHNLNVDATALRELFAASAGVPDGLDAALASSAPFADGLFKLLGAEQFAAIDASAFEGAQYVYDMNAPLSEGGPDIQGLRGTFDLVLDGGTLEHIFHFPTAMKNAMEMVKVGGHLFLATPTNNYSGHGFYQFSPELFFRVLTPENGFRVERMIAFEASAGSQWYEVTDPTAIGKRSTFVGNAPVLLIVWARRTHEAEILRSTPQQSDYAQAWGHSGKEAAPTALAIGRPVRGLGRRIFTRTRPWLKMVAARLGLLKRSPDTPRGRQQFAMDAQPRVFKPVEQ